MPHPADVLWIISGPGQAEVQWCMDSAGLGVGSSLSFAPRSLWLTPCTTFLASIGHSCVSLTSSREHACERDRSLLEHRADVGCLGLTSSSSLGLDTEWQDLWELGDLEGGVDINLTWQTDTSIPEVHVWFQRQWSPVAGYTVEITDGNYIGSTLVQHIKKLACITLPVI